MIDIRTTLHEGSSLQQNTSLFSRFVTEFVIQIGYSGNTDSVSLDGIKVDVSDYGRLVAGKDHAEAIMQSDGNLVVYKHVDTAKLNPFNKNHTDVLWASNTCNVGTGPFQLHLKDRSLFIEDGAGTKTWQANLAREPQGPMKLIMQRDGNLVLYDEKGAVWATNTDGHDC
eukprot:TRINITY_DN11804_c0_g1_i1.p1 TRINITY_DN11804_c0_g1~~TRINITY_DN11804_c0_g1_i1.p1  ORF type:complete len:170 (+),score=13.03 TRINITY_DN11804_c0_g1_i1:279-788(+)